MDSVERLAERIEARMYEETAAHIADLKSREELTTRQDCWLALLSRQV